MREILRWLARLSPIFVLLLVWEAVALAGLVKPFLLPAPHAVAGRVWHDLASGQFALNASLTLYRALVGFVLACVIGVPAGILIASERWVRWLAEPLISVGFPMPKIAFLPVFMLWFGVYDLSKIVMVCFAAIFAVVAAAEAGTRGVDKFMLWSARAMGASRADVFREVVLPAAMPQFLTGMQIALPVSLITAVAAEMLMGGAGLGGAMLAAGNYADSPGVFAGIVETSVVGLVAVAGMTALRRHLLRWHAEFNPRG
ncbi:MAG: ABC transporter permease [Acetobacteraceae bacterium]|nr:ABC transporter permease [Acetobacteraceae bacterium]